MAKDIRFTGMEIWKASFPLRLRFSHNLASRDRVETLVIALETSTGDVGYGQILPRRYLTGETLDSALHDVATRWWPALREMRFPAEADCRAVIDALRPLFENADAERRNASYAGLDIAAVMACAGATPNRFFGLADRSPRLPLVAVLSGDSPKKAARIARLLKWLGYSRFKVKVGGDVGADAARVAAVRRAIGKQAWLAADANAAWTWSEAVERMRAMRAWGVALVEEPLRAEAADGADFQQLEKETGIATMADESLCTMRDAARLLRSGSPSWWNLRLAKNGGFAGVAALANMADANGLHKYGGILVGETSAMAVPMLHSSFAFDMMCGECGFPRIFVQGDPFRGAPGGFFGNYNNPALDGKNHRVSRDEGRLRKHAELIGRYPE